MSYAGNPILKIHGLNPCCNGIYSMSWLSEEDGRLCQCLNPCCNGIYSMSHRRFPLSAVQCCRVLILVVMEYTQ